VSEPLKNLDPEQEAWNIKVQNALPSAFGVLG
jgi:hypothetical protein